MKYGTIFDRSGKKAVRHRVPEGACATVCGVALDNNLPTTWSERAHWGMEPKPKQKEVRCKKCYPKFRSKR